MTRNSERTRRALLDAATATIRARGTRVTLAAVADAAGVTKGGLLHHFPNRDALFTAVARDSLDQLHVRVSALVDLSENYPGKLLRAYIRALFDQELDMFGQSDYPGLWGALCVVPGVAEILAEDNELWQRSFAEDGLHPDRISVAQYAAEGVAATVQWQQKTDAALEHAQAAIIAITTVNGPIDGGRGDS